MKEYKGMQWEIGCSKIDEIERAYFLSGTCIYNARFFEGFQTLHFHVTTLIDIVNIELI